MPPKSRLAKLRADLTKVYGDRVTRRDTMVRPTFISSGSLTLDYALGGGFALKRTHEIVGPEGMGKTTQCILAMVDAQLPPLQPSLEASSPCCLPVASSSGCCRQVAKRPSRPVSGT